MPHELVSVARPQAPELFDVDPARVRDRACERRQGHDLRAASRGLAGDAAAHLAEAFDGDRPSGERAERGLGGDDDAEAGEHVLKRDPLHRLRHDARLAGPPQRRKVGLERAEVRAGEKTHRFDERPDLLAVAAHQLGTVFGAAADDSLCAAHLKAERRELVGHRPRE